MNVSLNWLKDYVDIPDSPREFSEAMTMSGTKVEGYEELGEKLHGIVVGKILSVVPHPDSDHMVICQVEVGGERPLQIVTGAQNVKEGDLVPCCTDGALLPDGKTIKTGKLRGVLSEGMLCSLGELGLTVHDFPYAIENGIFILEEDCKPGDDIRDVLGMRDTDVEFELTFNRPDCLSYLGIAREAAATFHTPLRLHEPVVKGISDGENISEHLQVEVRSPELCPRYTARYVRNVKIEPSPLWMRIKLRNAGIRPINNIVDITNYVMLEYGQPMHAFDAGYIGSGKIVVRTAQNGESITTLDGAEHPLTPEMLCIADGDKPVALAGIMGGLNSEILDTTTAVVFESANFARESIRKTSRAVNLRTESSAKFEKGLPACNTLPAIQRACELVELLGAGEVVDGIIDICNTDIGTRKVRFDWERVNGLLGTSLTASEMAELLKPLDLIWDGKDGLIVSPYRNDIINTADIAEEVVRLYGFDRIEATRFKGEATEGGENPEQKFRTLIDRTMTGLGFHETYTYSFVSPKDLDKICLPADSPLRDQLTIRNPLGEDTSVMRTHALPSILGVVSHNVAHRVKSAKFYENETLYFKDGDLSKEEKTLAFAFYGDGDFYDLKGYVEALLHALNISGVRFAAQGDLPYFHPGRCADLLCGDDKIGTIGQIHPNVAKNYDLDAPVYAALLELKALRRNAEQDKKYHPLPVYQSMERDIALLCDDDMEAGEVCDLIRGYAGKSLVDVFAFDVYKGKGIAEGKKSLAIRLVFRMNDRTMTDEEADGGVNKVLRKLENEKGITLRS